MRALWTGQLGLGFVSIPVRLHSALERDGVAFRQLHKADLAPVKHQRVCSLDGQVLEPHEVVRGYEYEKGRYTVVDELDLERVRAEPGANIDVLEFVARGDIDPAACDKAYLLAPGRGGERAYAVLREALAAENRVGVVRLAVRRRPRLGVLYVHGSALALSTLHTHDALRAPEALNIAARRPRWDELEMARTLIAQMSTRWTPERYHDEYRARLERLLATRLPRRRAAAPRDAAPRKVPLIETLRQSLSAVRAAQLAAAAPTSAAPSRQPAAVRPADARSSGSTARAASREPKRATGGRRTKRAAARGTRRR